MAESGSYLFMIFVIGFASVIVYILIDGSIKYEERTKEENKMYSELCLDEQFYYADSNTKECWKRGIKP